MKNSLLALILLLLTILVGCASGVNKISTGKGKLTTPEELASLQSGSLSTVWYLGSDEAFHYFTHFIKIETRYKIPKEELNWPSEYSVALGKSEFAGDELVLLKV